MPRPIIWVCSYDQVVTDDDPLLGYLDLAKIAGVKAGTLRSYRAQGRMPPPDDESVPDRPRWRLSTFQAWMRDRPGRGRSLTPHSPTDGG